jgi:hypothetical protein
MLNFFFLFDPCLSGSHRQTPKMDGCPFWASVALATPTTKQLKTHVARSIGSFYWQQHVSAMV